jgi:DNA ligase-1
MNLIDLVHVSTAVSNTRSRLKKRALLSDCLREAGGVEVSLVVNYLSSTMPQGRIGLGPATVNKALKSASSGVERVALSEVDRCLTEIAAQSGYGSKARKERLFGELLNRVSDDEQHFLASLVLGEVRQGALEAVLVEGIAEASGLPPNDVRRAVMLVADAAPVAVAALSEGAAGLSQFRLEPLKAVRPMLAQPADEIAAAMDAIGEASLQFKLDGARIQVHKVKKDVRIFTRQLHDVTNRLPEIVEGALAMPFNECILDGEAIAFGEGGRPLPFQVTMSRFGRSQNVADMRERLPLSGLYFDCLYADGGEMIDKPLSTRLELLQFGLDTEVLVPQVQTGDPAEAAGFLAEAFEAGHEGLMAKSLTSAYAAGSRGAAWLKIKQAHTLDLVVIAAEWGSGRRKGYLSNLHLAARGTEGEFIMLGKTFKGLTDKILRWQTKELLAREIGREENVVHVRPELVVEIAVSDIQQSPQYPAGLALRFARVRHYRSDKTAAQADSVEAVRKLFDEARG